MKIFRFLMSVAAILTSPAALAEDAVPPSTETITTTKTIGRVEEDGSTQPLHKETTTETLIDIPVKKEISPTQTVPCQDLPPIVTPSDEFIENNDDDDSDIESEVEGEVLINDKGEIGYALDEVPAELLEENPVYPISKNSAVVEREITREVEQSVDEALDEEAIEELLESRETPNLPPASVEAPAPAAPALIPTPPPTLTPAVAPTVAPAAPSTLSVPQKPDTIQAVKP